MKRGDTLYSIVITLHNGDTINLADDANNRPAKSAFEDFKNYRIIKCETSDTETTYIPFHSVLKVDVTTTKTQEEFEDDTCVPTEG